MNARNRLAALLAAGSLVMAAAAYRAAAGVTAAAPGDVGQLLALLVALPVAAVVFIIGQRALNCPELLLLRGSLRQMGGSA